MTAIAESCWSERGSGSGSCNIVTVAQRRRRNRFSSRRWSHAVALALPLMVAVSILPYQTNGFPTTKLKIGDEFVTTTSADPISPLQQANSESAATAVVNSELPSDESNGCTSACAVASGGDDFVGSNVEFRESALSENLEETIRNSVKNEIEMEQNTGPAARFGVLKSNAKTEQGEKLAEDILHKEFARKESGGDDDPQPTEGEHDEGNVAGKDIASTGDREERENNINNDIPEVELERSNEKESVREARNLDPEVEQGHNLLAEQQDGVPHTIADDIGKKVAAALSSSAESASAESYSEDGNDENDINAIDSDLRSKEPMIEELATVRAVPLPLTESFPKTTKAPEPEPAAAPDSTEIKESAKEDSGESNSVYHDATISLSPSPSSDSFLSAREFNSTNAEYVEAQPAVEPKPLIEVEAVRESTETPVVAATTLPNDKDSDLLSIVLNETLSATEPIVVLQVDEPLSFQLDEKTDEEPTHSPIIPEDGVHFVIKKQGVAIDEPLPTDEEDESFSTAKEDQSLGTAEEDASFSTAKEEASLSTAEGDDSFSTAEKDDSFSTAEKDDSFSTAKEEESLSTAEDDDYFSTAKEDKPASNKANSPHESPTHTDVEPPPIEVEDRPSSDSNYSSAADIFEPWPESTSELTNGDSSATEDDASSLPDDFEDAIATHPPSPPSDETAATLFDTPAPRQAGQTFNDNLAAESSAGIGKALPKRGISEASSYATTEYRSTTLVLLGCGMVALLFVVFAIFLISTYQRHQGTLDIEMQEKRCGKDDFDEDGETCMKLLDVELPPVSVAAVVALETDDCL